MPVRLIDRSRTRDLLERLGRGRRALVAAVGPGTALALVLCLAAAIIVPAVALGWLVCVRDTDTMLETAQARAAAVALIQRAGPGMGVRTLEITPREMIVLAVDKDRPAWRFSRHGGRSARNYIEKSPEQIWRITHRTLFWGWRDWINVPDPVFEDERWHKAFDLRPEDIPDLAEMSRTALDGPAEFAIGSHRGSLRPHRRTGGDASSKRLDTTPRYGPTPGNSAADLGGRSAAARRGSPLAAGLRSGVRLGSQGRGAGNPGRPIQPWRRL